jgi:signal transduction histidine kinase
MESEVYARAQELQNVNQKLREANLELTRLYDHTRELDRLKTEFLANVSHELRTPLTLILAPVESLLAGEYGDLLGPQIDALRVVHNNAVRLLQIVTGLLDFARLESGRAEVNREAVEIVALTRTILNDFQPAFAKNVLESQIVADPPRAWVQIDRYLYERILFNLLSNAVKFTPAGGQVSVRLQLEKDRLRLSVSDTGPGISQADQQYLFQKFHQLEGSSTRRFEGTGLGLALVREFAGLLGGSASVASTLGSGSTFTVECLAPVCDAAPVQAAKVPPRRTLTHRYEPTACQSAQPAPVAPAADRPRVLIAEDNEELATYIGTLLEGDCEFHIVTDGEAALTRVQQDPPDLILADVMMPRRDGISLCQEVKSSKAAANIPVILLTALTHREALLKGWEAGADEYLFKPFHPKELVTRVRGMIAVGRQRKEHEETRSRIQEELEQQVQVRTAQLMEANRRKDAFLTMLAHELRNPLAPLRNALHVLRRREGTDPALSQGYERMERQVLHLGRIVDDLLDVSRIVQGKIQLRPERLDLARLVRNAVDDHRSTLQQAGLTVDADLPEVPVWALGDSTRISQIVANLLDNAAKFTGPGGRVNIQLVVNPRASNADILVRDTGIGIERDLLPRLFETFTQADQSVERRTGGLGLGLSLVKGLSELHGGAVHAASAGPGCGAEFTIRLPVLPEPRALATMPAGARHSGKPLHVLVVEDNRDAAETLRSVLQLHGHKVAVAYSGPDGVETAERWQPDVVLCDIGLPGLDGYGVAGKLRQNPSTANALLVAVTGYGQNEDRYRSHEAGFDRHLVKPVDPEVLLAILTARADS